MLPITCLCSACLPACLLQDGKLAVLVGTITDDVRLFEVPKMRVCALRVTETARARILKVRACLMKRQRLAGARGCCLGWGLAAGCCRATLQPLLVLLGVLVIVPAAEQQRLWHVAAAAACGRGGGSSDQQQSRAVDRPVEKLVKQSSQPFSPPAAATSQLRLTPGPAAAAAGTTRLPALSPWAAD